MSYAVTIEPIGETIQVEEGQSVLDACLRAGIYLPHACGHGLCGTCKLDVLAGQVDHGDASPFALMDFERDQGKTLACCCHPLEDIVIEADIEEDPDAENLPVGDFSGTVSRLIDLTPTAKGVFIEVGGEGVAFQAGQYIYLKIPGCSHPRAFSLANAPSERNSIELNIRHVPDGKATSYIHNRLKVGDRIEGSGPYGRFFVRGSAGKKHLLLAGGTGLSSPKSMILDLLESGDSRAITLVYGARNLAELYYDGFFRKLADEHANFTYVPTLSEPQFNDGWTGQTGFVHEAATEAFSGDFQGHKAYICGPPPMIDACVTALMRGRLFERDMYMERFFTAADSAKGAKKSPLFKRI